MLTPKAPAQSLRAPGLLFVSASSELFADHTIKRIRASATDRNRKTNRSNQEHIFITATSRRVAFGKVYKQQCNEHFDSECRRKEACKQTQDQADASDQLQEHDEVR